ncbi:YciI family protein [Mucilaginibacter sp. AW1-3]
MKTYLVLFREPDGRLDPHAPEEIKDHRTKWALWQGDLVAKGLLMGGNALTLNGVVIGPQAEGLPVSSGPYYVNQTEIVGGYLIIKAANIADATVLIKTCPVFDFGALAEIREMM